MSEMIAIDKAKLGLGFERIDGIPGSTYKDNSTIVIVPMRGVDIHTDTPTCERGDHRECKKPMVHSRVLQSWMSLMAPMNQKKAFLHCYGDEVGVAYNNMIANILANPDLSKWKYILTLEDDNLPPPDAHIRLLESIEQFKFDAVSGIYFTKGEYNQPMAYGDPEEFRQTGVLEFRPRDIREALQKGQIMEVNGIAMGVGLWRMDLFRQIPPPWFVSVSDIVPEKGAMCMTQDLFFCEKAKRAGKRFGVDMRVRVGHLDIPSGIVY